MLKARLTSRVNVADAMQFWTSNVLKSTKHRVQVPQRQRYSLVYFVIADPDTVSPQDLSPFLILLAFETNIRHPKSGDYDDCQGASANAN